MIVDQSVVLSLLDHLFSEPNHLFEVVGYLGGSVRCVPDLCLPPVPVFVNGGGVGAGGTPMQGPTVSVVPGEVLVNYVTHFWPCERTVDSLCSGEIREHPNSYAAATAYFAENKCTLLGWYKSNNPMKQPIPGKPEVARQFHMQQLHPHALGLILSLVSSNRPSRFFPEVADPAFGAPLVAPVHSLTAFRALTGTNGDSGMAEEVLVSVLGTPLKTPQCLRSGVRVLANGLRESVESLRMARAGTGTGPGATASRSQHLGELDAHVGAVWRDGVLEAVERVDEEFGRVAVEKARVREWIRGRLEALRGVWEDARRRRGLPADDADAFEACVRSLVERKTEVGFDPVLQALSRLVTNLSLSASSLPFMPPTVVPAAATAPTPPVIHNPPPPPAVTPPAPSPLLPSHQRVVDDGKQHQAPPPPPPPFHGGPASAPASIAYTAAHIAQQQAQQQQQQQQQQHQQHQQQQQLQQQQQAQQLAQQAPPPPPPPHQSGNPAVAAAMALFPATQLYFPAAAAAATRTPPGVGTVVPVVHSAVPHNPHAHSNGPQHPQSHPHAAAALAALGAGGMMVGLSAAEANAAAKKSRKTRKDKGEKRKRRASGKMGDVGEMGVGMGLVGGTNGVMVMVGPDGIPIGGQGLDGEKMDSGFEGVEQVDMDERAQGVLMEVV
ncbi:hypothetical protein HK101_009387 [Irineochytrium annulatum]|nr:hypothetical protein HK101_009387 [Irineochytrium annulatum]